MSTQVTEVSEQLNDHFMAAIHDAEALVKATANLGGEKLNEARARAEESLKAVKVRMADARAAVTVKAKAAANATDTYVHENPWEAIGIAAGVGLVIGVLSARR